jgi:protein-L-isoaspartate(D-aspartate) O-methyltransferase
MCPVVLPPTFDGRRAIPSKAVTDLILELLKLTPNDKLLEIGTGSGYQTQRFAESGCEVHSIELEPWVDSQIIVGECVFLHSGDGALGLPQFAPFTAIVATCGIEEIPRAWEEQLDPKCGRLVAPIGDVAGQRLALFRMDGDRVAPVKVSAYTRFQMLRTKPSPKPLKPVYKQHGE